MIPFKKKHFLIASIAFVPLALYFLKFSGVPGFSWLSSNPKDWSAFGVLMGATLTGLAFFSNTLLTAIIHSQDTGHRNFMNNKSHYLEILSELRTMERNLKKLQRSRQFDAIEMDSIGNYSSALIHLMKTVTGVAVTKAGRTKARKIERLSDALVSSKGSEPNMNKIFRHNKDEKLREAIRKLQDEIADMRV